MPLWDSVHRGLEKASQEAGRIAKIQRLRSTVDGLSRQMNTQNNNLINKTMELFFAGQLTQTELLPFCQELANLHHQLQQAQNDLRQLQANQPGQQPATTTSQISLPAEYLQPSGYAPPPPEPMTYSSSHEDLMYAPPPPEYSGYLGETQIAPPPPPDVESLTTGQVETVMMNTNAANTTSPVPSASPEEKRLCPACQAELHPNYAFCHSCGTLVQEVASQHLSTMRATGFDPAQGENSETVRPGTPQAPSSSTESAETIRENPPPA